MTKRVADIGIGLSHTFGVPIFGLDDNEVEGDREHQSVGSAKILSIE
jgi:hypothetical protein